MSETAYVCDTNFGWSKEYTGSSGDTYTVTFGFMPRPYPVEYDWSCTCPGFKFRGKCKHVDAAKKEACRWNWEYEVTLEPGRDDEGRPVCPVCGGPVKAVAVLV